MDGLDRLISPRLTYLPSVRLDSWILSSDKLKLKTLNRIENSNSFYIDVGDVCWMRNLLISVSPTSLWTFTTLIFLIMRTMVNNGAYWPIYWFNLFLIKIILYESVYFSGIIWLWSNNVIIRCFYIEIMETVKFRIKLIVLLKKQKLWFLENWKVTQRTSAPAQFKENTDLTFFKLKNIQIKV